MVLGAHGHGGNTINMITKSVVWNGSSPLAVSRKLGTFLVLDVFHDPWLWMFCGLNCFFFGGEMAFPI